MTAPRPILDGVRAGTNLANGPSDDGPEHGRRDRHAGRRYAHERRSRVGTAADQIRQALEQDILTNRLLPGDRLDETRLAERFGISRTPVREALSQLAASGLVEIRRNRGATVTRLGLAELVEMFEVMAELEGMCGRLAAQRASEQELTALQEAHEDCARHAAAGQSDDYYKANMAFHEAIYRASHNRFLAAETVRLRNRLSPYRRLQLRRRNRLTESFAEHESIVAAIREGRGGDADALLSRHVTRQSGSFNDFLASLPTEYLKSEAS